MINHYPGFGPAPESEPFWFLGGQARILLSGSATADARSLTEFADPIGHPPPLHVHEAEEELWSVLDGEMSFFVGDERHDLVAGQVAHGPRGVPHSYPVRPEAARLAVVLSPAGTPESFTSDGSPVAGAGDRPPAFDLGAVVASAEAFRPRGAVPQPTR